MQKKKPMNWKYHKKIKQRRERKKRLCVPPALCLAVIPEGFAPGWWRARPHPIPAQVATVGTTTRQAQRGKDSPHWFSKNQVFCGLCLGGCFRGPGSYLTLLAGWSSKKKEVFWSPCKSWKTLAKASWQKGGRQLQNKVWMRADDYLHPDNVVHPPNTWTKNFTAFFVLCPGWSTVSPIPGPQTQRRLLCSCPAPAERILHFSTGQKFW